MDIKALLKKQIPESQLIAIKTDLSNVNQLTWYKTDKEFMYKGKMYDVVRSEKKTNSVTYYCISDSKETELRATLNKYIKENIAGNSSQKNDVHQLFKKFIQSVYTLNPVQEIFCPEFNYLASFSVNSRFTTLNLDVLIPPPKQIAIL